MIPDEQEPMRRLLYIAAVLTGFLFLLCGLFTSELHAQAPNLTPAPFSYPQGADTTPRYQVISSRSLVAAAETLTVQQVAQANAQKTVIYENAWVWCSAVCSIQISQNGTAATSTAATIMPLNLSPPSTVTAWSASNVGTGAFVSNVYTIPANSVISIDLSKFYSTQNGGTGQNLSVKTGTFTGTVNITIQWVEK